MPTSTCAQAANESINILLIRQRLQEQFAFIEKNLEKESVVLVGTAARSVPVGLGEGGGEAGFFAAATGQRKNASTEALRLELIPCTVDESFLLELLTYSTYCDNFTTTRADLKGPVILGALM